MADKDFKIEFGLFSEDNATLIDRQVFDRPVTVRTGEVLSFGLGYPVVLTDTSDLGWEDDE